MSGTIDRQFGTARGAIRLALAYPDAALNLARADLGRARRLVFVCQGNICRSSFADVVARSMGLRSASFGLATTTGMPAFAPVMEIAKSMGYDMDAHRTTAIEDFVFEPQDLLLAMEMRQIRKLAALPASRPFQADLLGRYVGVPHLHDPHVLSRAYTRTCMERIERAVHAIGAKAAAARA